MAVDLTVVGGPGHARCYAPLPDDDADAWERAQDEAKELRIEPVDRLSVHRAALALCDEHGQRFFRTTNAMLAAVDRFQLPRIVAACTTALQHCAPFAQRGSEMHGAWFIALRKGAQADGNRDRAIRMALCASDNLRPRPDQFYGRPVGQLTLGQLWAFDAACDVHHKKS